MSISFSPRPQRGGLTLLFAAAVGLTLAATSALAAAPLPSQPLRLVAPPIDSPHEPGSAEEKPGSAGSLELSKAVSLALSRASLLKAGEARLESARQEAKRAGQLPDPELVLGIDNLPVTGRDAFDFSADMMTQKRIGLRQVLPARGKRAAARSLAERRVDEAVANITAESIDVRLATAQAWFDAWTSALALQALGMLREEAVLASQVAQSRVSAGAESPSDALATQAEVIELDYRIAGVNAEREAAITELSRWTGVERAPAATLAPDLGTLPVPLGRLLSSLDQLAPLLQTNAQLESAGAEVDAARAEKRPDWSVSAAYGQRDGGRSDMLMLEVGVGLPLFTRSRQDRGIAARQADYDASLHEREDLRRRLAARIQADAARWQGLKRQVALYNDALIPLARDRSTTALAGYRAGGDLQPWINARRDEVQAQLAQVESLGKLGRAWAALAYLLPQEGIR